MVLPTRIPNLLVNGANGIAVGMATNIPPHNLTEVVDACITVVNNPHATLDDLLKFVQGPDFPTGGIIYGRKGIRDAYTNGRGRFMMRARVATESLGKDRQSIIVTEIPYQVNKATLIKKMADSSMTRSSKTSPTSATNPTATACGSSSSSSAARSPK